MKYIFYITVVFLLTVNLCAQPYKFAWISDSYIGRSGADEDLRAVVVDINNFYDIEFVLFTGNISETGKNNELENASEILRDLEMPLYIIPGEQDTKWSESGCTKFTELWDDEKFIFEVHNDIFIGLNSAIPLQGGGGHIKPEDLNWLEDQLSEIDSTKEIYFVVHHKLNEEIDNWHEVTNLLRKKNIKCVFNGFDQKNKIDKYNGLPSVASRSTFSTDKESRGFTIVENTDSLINFFEIQPDTKPNKWGVLEKSFKVDIPFQKIKAADNYNSKVRLELDLNSTLAALPVYNNFRIYSADINGYVTCFDSTGKILWEYDAFGSITSTPVIIDGYFIVVTAQGDLITLNANNGEQIQSIGFDENITSQLIAFDYEGKTNLIFPKESDSKACVVLGTSEGNVYCYDVETLQRYWVFEKAEGMIETKPLRIKNKLIFGCWDTRIYCIDDRSGLLIWQWNEINNFYFSPAVCWPVTDGKKVYFTSPNKFLYAIDAQLGTTAWKKNKYDAWQSIGISNDRRKLFVKSFKDKFHIVSAVTSNWVKAVNVQFGLDTMPGQIIEQNRKIIFNSKNGNIYSIGKNYKVDPLLFLGNCRTHAVQKINDDLLLASNMDGRIILFSIK